MNDTNTVTEILLERIAEAAERNSKTLEAIEQLLVNEDGHASTLVRIESLADTMLTATEDIKTATEETCWQSHNFIWRWWALRRVG